MHPARRGLRAGFRRFRRGRAARWLGGAAAAAILGLGILWLTLPDPSEYAEAWPERTAYMRGWLDDREGEARIDYRPVPLSRIPGHVRRAVLVSEDAGFYGHGGFDVHEIRAAISEAWEEREVPRGASTITQQLARNLYLSPSRDPLRKLREALLALRLERALDKNRILELYLNVIEFGRGIYGVEAAAQRYFGTSISNVSRRQAAELAATIPSPRNNNPATRTRSFSSRARLAYARAFQGEAPPPAPEPIEVELEPPGADSAQAPPADSLPAASADSVPAPPPDSLAGPASDTAADTLAASRRDTLPGPDSIRTPLPLARGRP